MINFIVVKLFFAACAAVGVTFSNAFSQSVIFRLPAAGWWGGDSASCKSCAIYSPYHLNNDLATSSTQIHGFRDGQARRVLHKGDKAL